MIFFTSDTHYGQRKILEYSGRPFASIEEHDAELIARWNRVVGPEDTVYHLGDVSFLPRGETEHILSQLNGQMFLVPGNHDFYKRRNIPGREIPLAEWYPHRRSVGLQISVTPDEQYTLVHKPEAARGSNLVVLCGHVHEKWKTQHRVVDGLGYLLVNVGVDQWDYAPVSAERLKEFLQGSG